MCCWVCVCMWRVYGKSHWSCSTLCLVLQHSSQNSRGSDVSFHCFIINSDNMQFFFICNIVLLFHYLIQIICYMSSNVIANICDFLRIMRNLPFLAVLLIQFLLVDLRCHGDSTSIKKRGPHTVASTALDVLKLVRSSQVLVMTLLQTLCLYSFCIFWNWDLIHFQFCIS